MKRSASEPGLILGNISGGLQEFPNGIKVSLRKYV